MYSVGRCVIHLHNVAVIASKRYEDFINVSLTIKLIVRSIYSNMSMTDPAGKLVEQGELLASSGSLLEALICFQRAKALLSSQSSDPSVMGSFLEKLESSIRRSTDALLRNPVLTLGLKRGRNVFTDSTLPF